MKEIILATKNEHKAQEFRQILGEDFRVITQTEAGCGDVKVIEDGETFEENAEKKARAIASKCKGCVIADDSGLCVDYLGGAPGVHTARFAGEDAGDSENIDKLLLELSGAMPYERGAKFVCVIALCEEGKETRFFRGECPGRIALERKGENGFGYDPVFIPDKYASSMAQLPAYIKNAISHRGKAISKLRQNF